MAGDDVDFDKPLVTEIYTADPSAHVFNDRIYVYPSHDRDGPQPNNDNGDQYDMVDYHVISMDKIGGPVTDHGVAITVDDIPWVSKQLWAPDAAYRDGKYYLFFPARDHDGIFRIGVAVSDKPEGPFVADPEPIKGSYSIDPAVFIDDDGEAYMYFGGLWGGQLQCWETDKFDASKSGPQERKGAGVPAQGARVAVMTKDLHGFKSEAVEALILDEAGKPLAADDHDRRFFEAAWMHKYQGKYYLSYSTGDTHFMNYAIGDSPLGPFTYGGRILEPVLGWTTHGSVVEFRGKWYVFHHDASLSKGVDHLRCVKVREIFYDKDGKISLTPPAQ